MLTGDDELSGEVGGSTIHQSWRELEIGPARWLSGDLVWRGRFMALAHSLFGRW
jgi:hypothetical protein